MCQNRIDFPVLENHRRPVVIKPSWLGRAVSLAVLLSSSLLLVSPAALASAIDLVALGVHPRDGLRLGVTWPDVGGPVLTFVE